MLNVDGKIGFNTGKKAKDLQGYREAVSSNNASQLTKLCETEKWHYLGAHPISATPLEDGGFQFDGKVSLGVEKDDDLRKYCVAMDCRLSFDFTFQLDKWGSVVPGTRILENSYTKNVK